MSPSSLSHLPLFLLCSIFLCYVHAQTPTATQGPSFASVEGQYFLITGGRIQNTVAISQTFKIDLSVSWNTTNPAITFLERGPAENFVPATMMPDNRTFVLFTSTQPYTFDMSTGWRAKVPIPNMTPVSSVIYPNAAAVDPSSKKVYVPNGITQRDAAGNVVRSMLEYDVESGASKSISQSGTGNLSATEDYAVVWSTSLNKLLVFGGRSSQTTFNLNLYAYTPSSDQWRVLPTNGDGPGGRSYACMVPAYGGSKFVVFGGEGYSPDFQDYSDIYVLDVSNPANLLWTRLAANLGPALGRGLSACAVNHDLFITWAGGVKSLPVTTNITMVFNLKTKQWINEFTPSGDAPLPTPTPENTPDSKNFAGIIGGSLGGIALVVVVACVVYRRSRSLAQHDKRSESPRVSVQDGFQDDHGQQTQGHKVRRSGIPNDYEVGAMSTVLGAHGYEQHQRRSPQSLQPAGAVAWEPCNVRPHDPQNLEHAQRFSA